MLRLSAAPSKIQRGFSLTLVLAVAMQLQAAAQPFTFTYLSPSAPFLNYGDASFGDIDGDGRFDILAIGNTRSDPPFVPTTYQALTLDEFQDSFSGRWRVNFSVTNLPTALWHGSVAWRDFDGDGDVDALATGATSPSPPYSGTTVLLTNDSGLLSVSPISLPGLFGSSASWADYDSDGDLDVLLIGAESADVFKTVLLNNDGGSFVEVAEDFPDLAYGDIAWADFDNDGDQDVLLSGAAADGTFETDVYRNTDGEFEAVGAGLARLAFSSADWGDYDLDGDMDLLLSGGELSAVIFDGLLHVYRNDGGTFSLAANLVPTFYGDARWGDYDSDGDPDIVVAGSESATNGKSVRVFQNEGEAIFVERTYLTGISFASVEFADYDGDFDPDVLVSGLDREGALLGVYRNDSRVPNSAPSVPGNLRISAASGTVTLFWDASIDEQSGSGAITYNVRVGTTPGNGDIVSATTSGTSARRLVSAHGNADQSTSLRLSLPNGSYFWTVQAIDASFAASEFATEQPLNITGKGSPSATDDAPSEGVFSLSAPYPNPSFGEVTFRFTLAEVDESNVGATITVFDARGSRVAQETIKVGTREGDWVWDSRGGAEVAAGIYFVHLAAGSESATRKVMIVR